MPREITYKCKQCGVAKTVNNHWYVLEQTNVGFHLYMWGWAVREDRLDDEAIEYLCGQACAHQLLDQFLASVAAVKSLPTNSIEDEQPRIENIANI